MITRFEGSLEKLSIHAIGNKLHEDPCRLSELPVSLDNDELCELLLTYFITPFEKVNELYHLSHPSGNLGLNEIYHFAETIFSNGDSFHENSGQIARHLYEVAVHPKIKAGELYVAYFNNLQIEGELHNAIGVFKSENKETYLKANAEEKGFSLLYEREAINIKKLDKGCLVFNTEKANGYKVAVIDQTNNAEAAYWIDDFLQLKVRNDNYQQTNATLSIYKKFVTTHIEEDFDIGKADKIDLLNRSIKYFKEKDQFDLDEFSNEVIGYPEGIESFKQYKKNYEQEYEMQPANTFEINNAAVKKQARVYKSVLKLDRNFHIYIHGNRNMIEKGFDAEKNMNYYKVYFKDEQ